MDTTENLYSVWKRDTDYHDTWSEIGSKLGQSPEQIQQLRPLIFGSSFNKDRLLDDMERALKEALRVKHPSIVVVVRKSEAKIFNHKRERCLRVFLNEGVHIPIQDASPYIKSLRDVALQLPNVQVSFVGKELKQSPEIINDCRTTLSEQLADYVQKLSALG